MAPSRMELSSAATWTALCFKCANQCVPADARLPQTPILTPKGKFKLDKHWLGRKLERSAGTLCWDVPTGNTVSAPAL